MEIDEYAIENDTFKILQQYEPFENIRIYFEIVDAKLKSRGKVNLYVIQNYNKWNAYLNSVSTYTGGGLIPAIIDASLNKHSHQEVLENYSYLYVLEESETGYIQALSSKNESLMETLLFFFSETYVSKYREVKGEITYKSIPALVELYNSK